MLIHERGVYPSDLSIEKMISHRSETSIRIVPTQTKCAPSVQSLSPDDRECLFGAERRLEYFGDYKENNCDVECRMKQIIQYCDCLPYYFRILSPNVTTCNFTQIACLVDNYCKWSPL